MNYRLTDVGTRYKHYEEMLNLWEDGLAILENRKAEYPGLFDSSDEAKLAELTGGVKILRKQIDILADYYASWSGDEQIEEAHRWVDKEGKK